MAAATSHSFLVTSGLLGSFPAEWQQALSPAQISWSANCFQTEVLRSSKDCRESTSQSSQLANTALIQASNFRSSDDGWSPSANGRILGFFSLQSLRFGSAPGSVAGTAVQLGYPEEEEPVTGGGDGNNGRSGSGGSGDDGAGGFSGGAGEGGGEGSDDYGPILSLDKVVAIVNEQGITLPQDMLDYAKISGIPAVLLERYIKLQGGWLGPFAKASGVFRDRMLADPSFLFKIATEVSIDSCCATFAEVKQRGKDFWKEFDLYASDLLVGIVLDVALVGMLAPAARFAAPQVIKPGLTANLARSLRALPNSIFEGALPGQKFSVAQRAATWVVKGLQYGVAGASCGLVGQGFANSLITVKRHFQKAEEGEEEVRLPSVIQTAALWSVFMALSSNTRYQAINGLERIVETSAFSKKIPFLSSAFTVGIRFSNNIFGGMQFVDWARWSGVQ